MHEKSVSEIDFEALTTKRQRTFHPSPEAWEDQILYFLLLDRFSDGKEKDYRGNDGKIVHSGSTPPFVRIKDAGNAITSKKSAANWREAGNGWVGGNLKGLRSKLGYLKRLGITTLWISPVLQQAKYNKYTYHGYGTQNFLEVDPHFGTREDLRDLVAEAHDKGLYVVLDVILNHTADVFAYEPDRYAEKSPDGVEYMDARWDGREYPVKAFRDEKGELTIPFGPVDLKKFPDAYPGGAIWPAELQQPEAFTRKGHIVSWDHDPEYIEGDFFDLKDVNLGVEAEDSFTPSEALKALCQTYKFWIAYADLDGFRLDTVKHMGIGAVRYFAEAIHEFAQSIGKNNFYIIGEIAGGRGNAFRTLRDSGLDAALGVDEIPTRIRDVIAGRCAAIDYFDLFTNSPDITAREADADDPNWPRRRVVTFFDDHDQIGRPIKGRLAAEYGENRDCAKRAVVTALGLNLTTLGIPCIYYGTEQALSGHAIDEKGDERYSREAMFGGAFGPFESKDRHVFNESSNVYHQVAAIAALRTEHAALRRGRQYLRQLQVDGADAFDYPENCDDGKWLGLVAWSRVLSRDECLCVLNTDFDKEHCAWITVDSDVHPPDSAPLTCLYSTDPKQIGTKTGSPEAMNGSSVCIKLPPGGFAIFR